MKIFFVITALLFSFLFAKTGSAQLRLNDNLAGPGISILTDKSAILFSGYFEHETVPVYSGLLGLGFAVKYANLGSSIASDAFIGGLITYNFRNIGESKFTPFLGICMGADAKFKVGWYSAHGGVRYQYEENIFLTGRLGLGNRWNFSPEIGVDFRF